MDFPAPIRKARHHAIGLWDGEKAVKEKLSKTLMTTRVHPPVYDSRWLQKETGNDRQDLACVEHDFPDTSTIDRKHSRRVSQ